jgi:hypothetical protein
MQKTECFADKLRNARLRAGLLQAAAYLSTQRRLIGLAEALGVNFCDLLPRGKDENVKSPTRGKCKNVTCPARER